MPDLFFYAPEHYVQFFTATILEWKPLLKQNKYKQLSSTCGSWLRKQFTCKAIVCRKGIKN
jgi:hypothetical protein